MKLKSLWSVVLTAALSVASLTFIAQPANAASADVTGQTWDLSANSAASSATDFTAAKYFHLYGTGVEEGSITRYNSAVTATNGVVIDAVQTVHTNCYASNIEIANVSASGGTVTFTTKRPHNLTTGMYVTTSVTSPAAYTLSNVRVASTPTDKTFTVTNAATGTYAANAADAIKTANPSISSITKSGTTYTVTTATPHGLVDNTSVQLTFTNGDASYGTAFSAVQTVASVIDPTTFTVTNATATTGTAPTAGYLSIATANCSKTSSWDNSTANKVFDLSMTSGYARTGLTYNWAFYEHGTYTGPGTGTPINVQGLTMWVSDIDDSSANSGNWQFAEFSGLQTYLLSKATAKATTCTQPASVNITNATVSGNSVTYTTDARLTTSGGLFGTTGTPISVKGVTPSNFNSTEMTLTAASTSAPWTYTATLAGAGTYASGGALIWNPTMANTNATSNPRCDDSNLNVNRVPGTNLLRIWNQKDDSSSNIPQDLGAATYASVQNVDVKLGTGKAGGSAIFALSFGAVPDCAVAACSSSTVGWNPSNGGYPYTNIYNTIPQENNLPTIYASNGVAYVLQTSDFGTYYDYDGNPFTQVKITSLPSTGKLQVKIAGVWTDVAIDGTKNIIKVADIQAGNLRFTGTNSTTFGYQVYDSIDYSTIYTATISIASQTQTITFVNPGTVYTNHAAFTNAASTDATGLTVTLTSNSTGICTVAGTTITLTGTVGQCSVTASQPGGSGYAAAQAVTQVFSVIDNSKTGQTITFAKPADQVFVSNGTISVPATTDASGLQVSMVSTDTSVCTVSGATSPFTVTMKALGACTLTASQAGDATRFAASSVSQTFQITSARYTLTFNGNNADSGAVPAAVTSPDTWQVAGNTGLLVKSGFSFSGWTDNSDGTGSTYAAGDYITLSGNKTIYAKWTAANFAITYADGGATTGTVPGNTTGSGSVTLALNTGNLAKTGYYFNGWTISASNYAAGGAYTLSGNVTATARWSQYTVTYADGGSTGGSLPGNTLGYGDTSLATNSGSLVKTGYYFDGWTVGGSSVAAGGTYTITGDVTATAKWLQYQVTYSGNGSDGGSVPGATAGNGSVNLASAGTMTKTGYYFNGWTISASNYAAGGAYTLSSNVTATARWSQYTVTYADGGSTGGSLPGNTLGYGSTPLASNTGSLVKSGYDFAGWTISASNYSEGQTYNITGNVTATARWTVSAYHITYTDSQATSGSVPSQTGGSGLVPVAGKGTLAYPNYYFAGWLINGLLYAPGDNYDLQADVTATASWQQYNLSYGDDFADGGFNPADTQGYGTVALAGNDNNLSRTGYYFDGWDISGTHYAAGANFNLVGNSHATPHWSQYTLTYDTNGADQTLGSVVNVGQTALDDGLTLTKQPLVVGNTTTTYVFGGWTIAGTQYNGGDQYALQGDVTATAIWNGVGSSVYTITYDGNNADSGSVAPDTGISVTVNGPNDLVKAGYTFGGWAWNGNTYAENDNFAFPTNADVTFTAIWTPIVYNLVFDGNGNSGGSAPADGVSTAGSQIQLPGKGNLANTGYTFGGWSINGVTYQPGDNYTPSGNETAYAIWTAIVHHFVYDGNGNDGGSVPTGFDGYGQVTIVGNTGGLTNGSKVFGGWSINGVTHLPGSVVDVTSVDVTAYAIWVDSVYTLSYQDDGSATSGSAPASVTGFGTTELSSNGGTLAWTGHHVDGWIVGGVLYALGADVDLTSGDLVATAHWAIDQITITYLNTGADSGVGPGSQTGNFYDNVPLLIPTDLVKAGYVQTGWLIEGAVWDLYDNGYLLTHDVTAEPIWAPVVHTVTFDCTVSTAGTCPSSLDSTAGSEIVLPDAGDLENYGYTFGGWLINGVEHSAGEHYVPSGDETATPIWNAIIYKVHYVGNGNTGGSSPADDSSVAFGGVNLADPGSLVKYGYTFGGWLIDGVTYAIGDGYTPLSGDVTATAIWNAIVYKVTYLGNSNTGGSAPGQSTSTALAAVLLAAKGTLVRSGYTFGGWLINGVTYAVGASYVPSGNVNATAVWNAIVYTVTYAGNGNDGGSVPANGVSTAGSSVSLAAPGNMTKSGYTFAGWSIGGTTYQPNTAFIPGTNVTATAVWQAAGAKTLTYSNSGATSGLVPAATSGLGNVVVNGNTGNLAKTGFTFGGWKIGGVVYQPGDNYNLTANATATPVWNAIVYVLSFDGNGSESGSVPGSISGYGRVTLPGNSGGLTRYGYTFGGWNIGGTNLAAGASYSLTSGSGTARAVWTPIVYVASFTNNGALGLAPANLSGFGSIQLPGYGTMTKYGFTFGGWAYNGTTYATGASFNLTSGNVSFTAVWIPVVYVLTFDGNGYDGGPLPATYSGFGRYIIPANSGGITKYGFTFGGWAIGGNTYAPGAAYQLVNGNATATAVWTPIVYTVSFDPNGGSGSTPANLRGFGSQTLPNGNGLSRFGFTFGGWNIGGTVYAGGSNYSLTSGNANASAVWNAIVNTLSFDDNGATGGNVPNSRLGFGSVTVPGNPGQLVNYGYSFGGWNIGGTTYLAGSSYSLVNGDATAYAIWTPIVYTLNYGSNNSEGGSAPSGESGFGSKTLPGAGTMTRYGYNFAGWQIGGTTYAPGSTYSLTSGNVTATPVWQKIVYTINYSAPEATSGSAPSFSGYGTIKLSDGSNLARTGYTLTGWSIANAVYSLGGSYSLNGGNVTATAIWAPIVYVITYANTNATGGSAPAASNGFGPITLPAGSLVRAGYQQTGWRINGQNYPIGSTYQLTGGSFTATPVWVALQYTVTFDPNGATGQVPNALNGFGTVTLPSAQGLSLPGFSFAGWQVNGVNYNAGDSLPLTTANVTAYAQWNAIVYFVTFTIPNATSGYAPDPVQGWGDLPMPSAATFKRQGFDFAGWKIGNAVYQPGQTVSVRRSNLTAAATWQTQVVYKEFSGFAAGSPLLTADMKSQITAWIKANPGFTIAECLGYTMGPTVLATDKTLATNRAQYTCSYVSNTFPRLSASGKWGGNDVVVGDPVRRVRITLHN